MPIRLKVVAEVEQLLVIRISGLRLDAFAFLVPVGNGRQVHPRIGAQQMPCLIVRLDLQNLVFSCRLVPLVVNLHHTLKPDSLKMLDADTSELLVVKRLAACQIAGMRRVRSNLPGQKRTQAERVVVEVAMKTRNRIVSSVDVRLHHEPGACLREFLTELDQGATRVKAPQRLLVRSKAFLERF